MKKMTSLTNFECSTNEDISARLEGLAQKASTPQEFIESCTPTLQRMGHLANFPGLVHFAAEMQHICLKMLKVECDVQLQKEEELKALANTEKQQRFVFLKENLKLKSELKEKEEKTVLLREEVQKLKAKIDQLEDKLVAASKVQTSASMEEVYGRSEGGSDEGFSRKSTKLFDYDDIDVDADSKPSPPKKSAMIEKPSSLLTPLAQVKLSDHLSPARWTCKSELWEIFELGLRWAKPHYNNGEPSIPIQKVVAPCIICNCVREMYYHQNIFKSVRVIACSTCGEGISQQVEDDNMDVDQFYKLWVNENSAKSSHH